MNSALLLPGLICDGAVWSAQETALNQADIATQVVDFGDLNRLHHMATHALAGAPEKFILIGHSMGGRVALEIARQAPERIQALVLMDTGYLPLADGDKGQQEVASRLALVKKAKEQGMREMGQEWMQGMVLPEHLQNERLCNDILDMIERKTDTQFAAQQSALLNRYDASDVLKTLTCPTCFICGDQDAWSPLSRHYEMAKLASDAPVYSIRNSGHMTTMEQPEQVNEVLLSWLNSLN
ncbi:alpha/beta fold hydrolase [Reinekea blandensis]|uniref:Hydrolase n=1 Tax=Reinekea blandensis MED297 TaxID=314283 RepID=A4BGY9_9GAMM|nr:alpha/beta hydrolase [Reinekea blandensis]EAR08635.1 hydrolase [Reinekea sp. MED297] [Reinekea blandensis MED297]